MIPEIILVQRHSGGRIKFIILRCDHDTVTREWGLIGGKTQTTSNTYDYINKGKANELSPAAAADADYHRLIDTKKKEGYIEVYSLDDIPELDNDQMDFDDLPVQFCCSKPHTSISPVKFNELFKNKDGKLFIKENGLCHFILVTTTGDIKIYTRRVDDHTRKYPAIVEAVKKYNFPPKTLMVAEFVVDKSEKFPKHMDRFKRISSISRSDTLKGKVKSDIAKTLALQEETPVIAVIFNILFINGENYTLTNNIEYAVPYTLIKSYLGHGALDDNYYNPKGTIRYPIEVTFLKNYDDAYQWAKRHLDEYEGFVFWNMREGAEVTYNGKPNRRACYKLKATREDDVVAYNWKEGTGAKQGKIGSLLIGKYNSEGELIEFGNVGSGLRIKEGDCEPENWEFPCVIEIEYEQRFPTGKYQFPRFNKIHVEKVPEEVIIDEDGL